MGIKCREFECVTEEKLNLMCLRIGLTVTVILAVQYANQPGWHAKAINSDQIWTIKHLVWIKLGKVTKLNYWEY